MTANSTSKRGHADHVVNADLPIDWKLVSWCMHCLLAASHHTAASAPAACGKWKLGANSGASQAALYRMPNCIRPLKCHTTVSQGDSLVERLSSDDSFRVLLGQGRPREHPQVMTSVDMERPSAASSLLFFRWWGCMAAGIWVSCRWVFPRPGGYVSAPQQPSQHWRR